MGKNIVAIGDKLEMIAVNNIASEQEKKIYKIQVLDIYSEHKMQVSMPIEGYKILLLPIGGKYDASFYSNNSIYTCMVQVADRYKKRNQYVLDIELVSPLKKYQRREFYRLDYAMDVYYRPMLEEEKTMDEDALLESVRRDDLRFFSGVTLDISGGGMRFVNLQKMHRGDELVVKFMVRYGDTKKTIFSTAKVLSSQNHITQRNKVEHRIEFVNMDKKMREDIVRFIFERDRFNRKKEKK